MSELRLSPFHPDAKSGSVAAEIRRILRSPEFSSVLPASSVAQRRVRVPEVTALPLSPMHGDEVLFIVDREEGPYWHLRYDRELDPPYQWIANGALAIFAEDTDQGTTTSTSFTDLTGSSVGPTLDLPLAGIYDITTECNVANDTVNAINVMSFAIGSTAAVDADGCFSVTTTNISTVKAIDTAWRKTIPAGSLTLTSKYRVSGGNGYFEWRVLSAVPVRVGRV